MAGLGAGQSTWLRRHRWTWFGCSIGEFILVLLQPAAGQSPGPSPVSVSTVIERHVTPRQAFVATVKPLRRSLVGSAVDGRVMEFLVNDGDAVSENQTLAKLQTDTLEIELAGAKAELELRRQELAELKNGSRPEEIDQAKARMAAAEAQLDYGKAKFDRVQILHQSGQVLSREEFDLARSNLTLAEQSLIEAQKAYQLIVAGPRQEKIAQAQARVQMHEQIVRQIDDRIQKHTVLSPFDGFVVAEHTERGAWVKQGDPIAELIDVDPVEAEVYVPEDSIRFMAAGISCDVSLDALPEQTFTGSVARIVPDANVRSRTFPVKILVANPRGGDQYIIKPGMLARVSLPVGPPRQALMVPKDALVLGQATKLVYVIRKGKVQPVAVKLGVEDGELIQVQDDDGHVAAGVQVVVRGNERLRPGQPVTVQQVLTSDVAKSE